MSYSAVQDFMREQRIDAWLVFDFRNSNPVLARILGGKLHLTRRVFWLLPARGEPTALCSVIDGASFKAAGIPAIHYNGWPDMHAKVAALFAALPGRRVAMEYSPGGALPTAGIVDAGTIEFIRALGVEVVSSADLVQQFAGVWHEAGLAAHTKASTITTRIMNDAWNHLFSLVRAGTATERNVQLFIQDQFKANNLEWPDGPIVSVNSHAGDPHYGPDENHDAPIKPNDWVLIDLWARIPGDQHVYSDITWTGFCGPSAHVPAKHREVFHIVRKARDASVAAAQIGWKNKQQVEGWHLDDAARKVIIDSGYAHGIKHRTGHSLSPGALVHGIGMNLDNLETHDTRRMMPGTGFTVEPGIYLPDFGVRNEINVYVDPVNGPVVTSCSQDDIRTM